MAAFFVAGSDGTFQLPNLNVYLPAIAIPAL